MPKAFEDWGLPYKNISSQLYGDVLILRHYAKRARHEQKSTFSSFLPRRLRLAPSKFVLNLPRHDFQDCLPKAIMSSASQVTAETISLTEFITLVVLGLGQAEVPMPFQNEEKWHRLLYQFKANRFEKGRPRFLDALRFDWDGPYPRSQDLSECLQTLHLNGFISVGNPSYDRLRLDDEVAKRIDEVRPNVTDDTLKSFLGSSERAASLLFAPEVGPQRA